MTAVRTSTDAKRVANGIRALGVTYQTLEMAIGRCDAEPGPDTENLLNRATSLYDRARSSLRGYGEQIPGPCGETALSVVQAFDNKYRAQIKPALDFLAHRNGERKTERLPYETDPTQSIPNLFPLSLF